MVGPLIGCRLKSTYFVGSQIFLSNCVGSLCPSSVLLKFETLSSNSFDKSVGDKGRNVCWKVSLVFTSRITFSLNLVP